MTAVFAGLAALHLACLALHLDVLVWLTKPLLMPVLAVHLWRCGGRAHPLVLAGLALATAGDVALLVPGNAAFVAGTGCFLGTQLCYLAAFVRQGAVAFLRARRWWCAAVLVGWAVAIGVMAPVLGPLAWAVVPYSLALVAMAAGAGVLGVRGTCGGVLFVGSDLLVGLGAAEVTFPGHGVLVMATYAAAQYLLVDAVLRSPRPSAPGADRTAHAPGSAPGALRPAPGGAGEEPA